MKKKKPKIFDHSGFDPKARTEFVDVPGIAKFLGCSKETINRLLARKKIPAHRVGKLWRFDVSEVAEWVKNDRMEM